MIRRKSDARRTMKECREYLITQHEYQNQQIHTARQEADPTHDPYSSCWCCCDDCIDLTWYYAPRKGVWWQRTPNGELRLMRETSGERPGSPEISPS